MDGKLLFVVPICDNIIAIYLTKLVTKSWFLTIYMLTNSYSPTLNTCILQVDVVMAGELVNLKQWGCFIKKLKYYSNYMINAIFT